ncbi:MAG: glycosyltransferase [Rubrobacteridae bacterium]|nr:glycosyltransferase [Rubrobacteridae bacterium]
MYPGLALAKALKRIKSEIEIIYVGTENGLEASIVRQAGLPFIPIESRGLPRKLSVKILGTVSSVGKGAFESRRILKQYKPDIVVGMGAYVSLPIVGIAALRGIPTLIHEQNATPGLVNRVLARVAEVVATSFPGMENCFPASKHIEFTGNPVREDILNADRDDYLS